MAEFPLTPLAQVRRERFRRLGARSWTDDYLRLKGNATSPTNRTPLTDAPSFHPPTTSGPARTRIVSQGGPAPAGRFGDTWKIAVEADEIRGGTDYTDVRLLEDVKAAAQALGLEVLITDALRHAGDRPPGSSPTSRHFRGLALDIGALNGQPVRPNNHLAQTLVQWLVRHRGYTWNPSGEHGVAKALLFANGDGVHHNHIHMSIQ